MKSLSAGKTCNPQTQHYQESLGTLPRVQQQLLGWKDLAGKAWQGLPTQDHWEAAEGVWFFSLQAFLLPTPHLCDLQMDEGPALQHRRLSGLLQSSVFPEFVSAPPLHISCSSAAFCQGAARAGSQELSLPQCAHSPRAQLSRQSQEQVTKSICSP